MSPASLEIARKANLLVIDAKTGKRAKIIAVYPQKNSCQLYFSQDLGGDGKFETIACNRIMGKNTGHWRNDDLRYIWTKALQAMRQARRRMEQLGVKRLAAVPQVQQSVTKEELYEYLDIAEQLIKEAKDRELKDALIWNTR